MNKIRKGDEVMVMAGRDKGARGVVNRIITDAAGKPEKVVVEGVNMLTHFIRPNPQKNIPGSVTKREAPIPAGKVAVLHPESKLPARVKITTGEDGKKQRVFHISKPRAAAKPAAPAAGKEGS